MDGGGASAKRRRKRARKPRWKRKRPHESMSMEESLSLGSVDANKRKDIQAKMDAAERQISDLRKKNEDLTQKLEEARRENLMLRGKQTNNDNDNDITKLELDRAKKIADAKRDLASYSEYDDVITFAIANHLHNFQSLSEEGSQIRESCSKTKKLIDDMQQTVTNMQSESGGEGRQADVDHSASVEAMNSAIIVLQEELKRHQHKEDVQKKALRCAKVCWNRATREKIRNDTEISKKLEFLEDLHSSKDITLTIGYPKAWSQYSEGQAIANLVASNCQSMIHLRLGGIILNDDDIALVATSLQMNTKLKLLELDGSAIDEVGYKALLGTLYNTASLNDCADSNHTCHVSIKNRQVLQYQMSSINKYDPKSNRIMKISALLLSSTKGRLINMDYFHDIPIKLMPIVLRLAQQFVHETSELAVPVHNETGVYCDLWQHAIPRKNKPLTCVFEMLRGWGVSALFG